MNRAALRTSVWLSALFLLVYGGSNQLAAHRAGVGSYFFGWERHIPFVPLMILPYMSIDLFFVAAPFVCDERGRKVFARRAATAILISGTFFVLMPLRFAFDRPALAGPLGMVFSGFRRLDRPFNQFPSLHVALLVILAGVYGRCTRGWHRLALGAWFALIGLSTVLTYQHHVIDVAGGLALGLSCVYLFPIQPLTQRGAMTNKRVAGYYAIGAAVLLVCALAFAPLGYLLLWPVISLTVAAIGYLGAGASVYRKAGGRVPLSTWFVLWPVLVGQRISLWHYRRHCRGWDVLSDRVWIGRVLSEAEASEAVRLGVATVIDLTAEFSQARALRNVDYHPLPILDLTAPSDELLDHAVDCIRRGAERGIVYVHCKIGYSRTAAVAGAYLLASGLAFSVDDAVVMLRRARPTIVIRPEAREALNRYHARRFRHAPSQTVVEQETCSDSAVILSGGVPAAVEGSS